MTKLFLLPVVILLTVTPLVAQTHEKAFSTDGLVKIPDATAQPNFLLTAHPSVPIKHGQNVLWCDTFQLAWNEATALVGEPLTFKNPPQVVYMLDRQDFTKADLDPSCYVAVADFERNHVEDEVRAELQKKFNGQASPELIPNPPAKPGPDEFLAYAYLFKGLAFTTKFYKHNLIIKNKEVKGFGFLDSDPTPEAIWGQVKLLSYNSDNDFVIQLETNDENEQLILAKVSPEDTLSLAMDRVMARVNHPKEVPLESYDELQIPTINFDATSHYPELTGLTLVPSATAKVRHLQVAAAIQNVRFQLNEEGAELKSEGQVIPTFGLPDSPPRPRHLVFDEPFLILLKEKKAAEPYFALWVENTDLFTPSAVGK